MIIIIMMMMMLIIIIIMMMMIIIMMIPMIIIIQGIPNNNFSVFMYLPILKHFLQAKRVLQNTYFVKKTYSMYLGRSLADNRKICFDRNIFLE